MTDEAIIHAQATSTPIQTDGPCLQEYLSLVRHKMGPDAATATRDVAIDVVSKCIQAYEDAFGKGEVGDNGSGRVTPRKEKWTASGDLPPTTGLLYGKVQSGKTNASMASVALALANGFRVFVVLTSDNTLLGTQTAERFSSLTHGPTIYQWREWLKDPTAFGKRIADEDRFHDTGVVFVSTKNTNHLANLTAVLTASGAGSYPAIVIDDEADNASLNTNEAKAAKGKDVEPSKIFERIWDIRSMLAHHVYLQVTATPQALLLQAIDHECKPRFCALSEPGAEYIGGSAFFEANSKLQVAMDSSEFDVLRKATANQENATAAPEGLRLALATFLLACAQKHPTRVNDGKFSFLAHVDVTKVTHGNVARSIDHHISWLDRALRDKLSAKDKNEAEAELHKAWKELSKTCADLRPIAELRDYIDQMLRNVRAVVVISEGDSKQITYRIGPNIFVGGNRLGRGVTIEGLITTYYGRDAKTKMMDVVHQHARMFGYRKTLLDVTRLFSTPPILAAFKDIHDADEAMREAIGNDPTHLDIKPVWVGPKLKPTRAAILNPNDLGVIVPGRAIYPWHPKYKKAEVRTDELNQLLAEFGPSASDFEVRVGIDVIRRALALIPSVGQDGHVWTDARVQQLLQEMEGKVLQVKYGWLNVRGKIAHTNQRVDDEPTDTGSGGDIKVAKTDPARGSEPTLFLRRQGGEKKNRWDDAPFWAPTLLIPVNHRFVFTFSNVGGGGS